MTTDHYVDIGAGAPSTESPPRLSPPRLAFLDGIRAVAAVYVVLHHVYLIYPGFPDTKAPMWATWLSFGHFAVAVFIVLSGFSLTLAPARNRFEMTSSYLQFMWRRARRILPPYWVALALSVLISGVVLAHDRPGLVDAKGVLTHFFVVQDIIGGKAPNGAFWSIAVEWQLYFFFPLFLFFRRRLGAPATVVLAVVGVWVAGVAAENIPSLGKLLHVSPQMAALFVMGIVASGAVANVADFTLTTTRRRMRWGWASVALTMVLVVLLVTMGTPRVMDNLYWLDLLVGAATATGLIALARGEGRAVRRVLASRPFVQVGHFSYSLYLVHSPLLLAAWVLVVEPMDIAFDLKFILMVVVVVPLVMVAAYGFSIAFERPFQGHRKPRGITTTS